MTARSARLVAGLCLVLLGGAGCVDLPTSGPVVSAEPDPGHSPERAADVDARPPQQGATPSQVAIGFLDAMTAWPIETNVAKKFLTRDAAEAWNPDAGTIVYSEFLPPTESGGRVEVELAAADRLDGSGGWRGALTEEERSLDLRMVREDGEYRIANPPDALLVPTTWFQQRFRQVSLYFLDPVAEILVPEPVFVPIGEQLATSLVAALLAGPPEGLENVVRTMVPPGLSVGLSVPVNEEGVARIDLTGDAPPVPREAVNLLFAQLAWTLRQDPSISAFRVTIGGEEVAASGTATPYDVDTASQFDPAGAGASGLLYGLRGGLLVSGNAGSLEPVAGPFGQAARGVSAVAVTPAGGKVAAVVDGGTRLVQGSVQVEGEIVTVLEGEQLARPSWDAAERLWALDRTSAGARIRVVEDGQVRDVGVPGVTGTDARALLVSRDGTRLIAVVREAGRDRVVASRVVIDAQGGVRRAIGSTVIRPDGGPQVIDLAWADPVAVSLLTPARAGSLFEVTTIPANGGFLGAADFSVILRGQVHGIAGTPTSGEPLYAVRPAELVDVGNRSTVELGEDILSVDYAG